MLKSFLQRLRGVSLSRPSSDDLRRIARSSAAPDSALLHYTFAGYLITIDKQHQVGQFEHMGKVVRMWFASNLLLDAEQPLPREVEFGLVELGIEVA